MSSLVLQCPLCTKPFQVLAEQAGQPVQCPSCQQAVMVPDNLASATPRPIKPTSPEPIVFACPVCSGQFGIVPQQFGQKVGCPHCQTTVLVEAPQETSPTSKPPRAPTPAPVIRRRPENEIGDEDDSTATPNIETGATAVAPATDKKQPAEEPGSVQTDERADEAQPPKPAFVPKNIDHLLPPQFDVIDPEQLAFRRANDPDHSVVLPDGQGGLKKVDQRLVTIRHRDQDVTLIVLPPEVVRRKRMIQNTIFMLGGAIVLALIFSLLRKSV